MYNDVWSDLVAVVLPPTTDSNKNLMKGLVWRVVLLMALIRYLKKKVKDISVFDLLVDKAVAKKATKKVYHETPPSALGMVRD